jgi:hypothetical protein
MCDVAGDCPHAGIDLHTVERVASTAGSNSRQHGQGVQEPEDSQILYKEHCLQVCVSIFAFVFYQWFWIVFCIHH